MAKSKGRFSEGADRQGAPFTLLDQSQKSGDDVDRRAVPRIAQQIGSDQSVRPFSVSPLPSKGSRPVDLLAIPRSVSDPSTKDGARPYQSAVQTTKKNEGHVDLVANPGPK